MSKTSSAANTRLPVGYWLGKLARRKRRMFSPYCWPNSVSAMVLPTSEDSAVTCTSVTYGRTGYSSNNSPPGVRSGNR